MDPKKTQLDPKLKEVYDRVMGFNAINPSQTSPAVPQKTQIPQPIQTPPPAPASSPTILTQTPQTPIVEHKKEEGVQSFNSSQQVIKPKVDKNTQPEISGTTVKASSSKLPFIIVGLVLFFAAYAFVWIKVFKLNIPFLPL